MRAPIYCPQRGPPVAAALSGPDGQGIITDRATCRDIIRVTVLRLVDQGQVPA